MLQKTYNVMEYKGLSGVIGDIKNTVTEMSKSLLFVFDEDFSEERVQKLLSTLRTSLPELTVVGISVHNQHFHHADSAPVGTTLSLLCFEEAGFEVVVSDLTQMTERQAAAQTKNVLGKIADARGLFVFCSVCTDIQLYLDKIAQVCPDIPAFGATAAIKGYEMEDMESTIIMYNEQILKQAVLTVIFHGKHLSIHADEVFGWTPIAQKMTVTKTGSAWEVLEVDGRPAAEIFYKYLGLQQDQINADNVCEFPVYKMSGERIAPRISVGAEDNGGLWFGAPLNEGDTIRFTYGNPQDILQVSQANAATVTAFQPQALFLVVCMNRIIFLGKEQETEVDYFRQSVKSLAVIHGNSELFRDKKGGGELNSCLIYIAMREESTGENEEAKVGANEKTEADTAELRLINETAKIEVNETDERQMSATQLLSTLPNDETQLTDIPNRIPLTRRLLTFLNATTGELEDLRRSLSDEVERKTQEIVRQQEELNRLHIQIVMTLSNAIDAKDAYTNGHSRRVAGYSREIAKRYGYSSEEQEQVYLIGLLHDIGKIGVPDAIINKPGRLTEEEFDVIKKHPSIGADILGDVTDFPQIALGARYHHERYEGRGYPDGLKGEAIPEIAQIISVADAYDAMASNRSYRPVMPQEKVRSEIEKGRGTQFSPRFADIMLEMIDEDVAYAMKAGK